MVPGRRAVVVVVVVVVVAIGDSTRGLTAPYQVGCRDAVNRLWEKR